MSNVLGWICEAEPDAGFSWGASVCDNFRFVAMMKLVALGHRLLAMRNPKCRKEDTLELQPVLCMGLYKVPA